jgi:hypothetical protein
VLHAKSRHGHSVGHSGEEDTHQSETFWAQHIIYKGDEIGQGPDVRPQFVHAAVDKLRLSGGYLADLGCIFRKPRC